jgi:uncharacterized repeat protein (TIGR04052 family)
MTDLRFYVHNLRLEDADGQFHAVQLVPGEWQQADLALIDLEDGSGNCINGTTVTNSTARGTVSGQDFRALEFTLGVPFSKNHADPLQATQPLGDADMHWHWRGGYKFLRAGLKSESDSFWIHLGSTGCTGTIRNISGCDAPNRVTVRLEPFTPGDDVLVDLVALAGDDVLGDGVPTDCSSGPAEEDCSAAFAALGLNHATGRQEISQRLFSLRPAP